MADFELPTIAENADGWGPSLDHFPSRYSDIPYAPFSKSDRLGRAADWTAYGGRGPGGLRNGEDDEEGKFTVVDNRNVPRSSISRLRYRARARGRGRYDRGRRGKTAWEDAGKGKGKARSSRRWDDRRHVPREASVVVGADWEMVEEVTFSQLAKLSFAGVSKGVDVIKCGQLWWYDRAWDRVNAKNSRALRKTAREREDVTTTDDTVIRRLGLEGAGSVFVTSSILGLLMVAPRSAQPWDVVVQRIEGKLFFDKRDGSTIDQVTVNETSHDAPKDAKNLTGDQLLNSAQHLAAEATLINANYAEMVLRRPKSPKDIVTYAESNPFIEEGEEHVSALYRYRKWQVGDNITLIVRCEVNGAMEPGRPGGEPILLSVKALNEVSDNTLRAGTDWRNKLDTQRGAVLATELKNNATKLARWTAEALLADADQLKFGFVTRTNPRSNANHIVLGSQMYRPREFASQIALNVNNMWAIFKYIVETCYKHLEDGDKGVIMKDPNKTILRMYKVPESAFESDEKDDEELSQDEEYASDS